jgi:hypothetical protein
MNINCNLEKHGRRTRYTVHLPGCVLFRFFAGLITSFPIIEIARELDRIGLFRRANLAKPRFSLLPRQILERNVMLP